VLVVFPGGQGLKGGIGDVWGRLWSGHRRQGQEQAPTSPNSNSLRRPAPARPSVEVRLRVGVRRLLRAGRVDTLVFHPRATSVEVLFRRRGATQGPPRFD
jgi:hypothetical protein